MAFDANLANRVEDVLIGKVGIVRKKMFGTVCHMQNGKAFAGVWSDSLFVRVGPEAYDDALAAPHVREFDITGRPMRGWIVIAPDGIDNEADLRGWIERALRFVGTLPA
jgi:TfoX/Sxy family transcriptional regulator of competence genes